ncbi:MAG: polysaccharide pyruvyl transferase family protein [Clostridiaceae bacterium]|jgi:polysaccharide pyruvyl transferase WcaK-like protein|nr:polysaccharide pyruvyl transferase family protein [Clostridiaceae bacterium]
MNIVLDAYLDNNLGDDLMIKILVKHFPQHEFFLYSNSSAVKNTFHGIENITVKRIAERKLDFKKADAYVTIGGSRFQLVSLKQKFWRLNRLKQLSRLKRQKIKIATIGSNFGPFSGKFAVKLAEWELRKNDLVTVRDKEAADFLHQFKNVDNYHLADDIVYNLDSIYSRNYPQKSGLGISAYRSIRAPEYNFENYKYLAALADQYIRKTRKTVKLFAFDSENENDVVAALHIYDLAEEKDSYEIIPYLGAEEHFLQEFEACERIVAIRFHSAVLADIFEIPFLPVAYSNKMSNFLNDRGYAGPVTELKDMNRDLCVDTLAETIINGGELFSDFTYDHHNASVHFDELEKILNSK